jgi:hypothetical protein
MSSEIILLWVMGYCMVTSLDENRKHTHFVRPGPAFRDFTGCGAAFASVNRQRQPLRTGRPDIFARQIRARKQRIAACNLWE